MILGALSGVQVLASRSAVDAYGLAIAKLPSLRSLCETSEKWLGLDSKEDRSTARALCKIVGELTELMWSSESDAATPTVLGIARGVSDGAAHEEGDAAAAADAIVERVAPERQVFMQNIGVPALLLNLLEEGSREVLNRVANHTCVRGGARWGCGVGA